MVKYLVNKQKTFWYRRKITGFGEIVFSLKTKSYNKAILRHSYIDYKIKSLIYKGNFETMTVEEIRNLIKKYKEFMINEEYNEYEEKRDEELSITINDKYYGGHTKEALEYAIKRYQGIHEQNNLDNVKQETTKILKRANFTQSDLLKLKTKKDQMIFHWELFKAEWELLYQSYEAQKETVKTTDNQNKTLVDLDLLHAYQESHKSQYTTPTKTKQNISISELVQMYINEKKDAKVWSDKNERDLAYVFRHLANYYLDKSVLELERKDFSTFRDNVLKKIPKQIIKKEFIGKTTNEIIQITENKNYEKIGITTINKHIRRIHQVFEWAFESDYIPKNLTKGLELTDKQKSKKQKSAKIPYTNNELKIIFEQSPWFTHDIEYELKNNPEHIFIPLLALFTGAKPTELATLKTSSVFLLNDIWVIDFNKMIKGADTERQTPISTTLIDIGFLKFVEYQKKQKSVLLFPAIKIHKSGGTSFTNDFTVYNRKYISQDIHKTFYSFRHLINQRLKNKKIVPYIVNDITGHAHAKGDKDQEVYGDKQMPEEILFEVINECLIYDIDFSHIQKSIHKVYALG